LQKNFWWKNFLVVFNRKKFLVVRKKFLVVFKRKKFFYALG